MIIDITDPVRLNGLVIYGRAAERLFSELALATSDASTTRWATGMAAWFGVWPIGSRA